MVFQKGEYFNEEIHGLILHHFRLRNDSKIVKTQLSKQLTPHEIKILDMLCRFEDKYQIADFLNISHRTVEAHKQSIMKKIGTTNPLKLVIYALENNYFNMP